MQKLSDGAPTSRADYGPLNQCDHPGMTECHLGCGHWYCPDCDITWDAGNDPYLEEFWADYMVSKEDWDDLKAWNES